MNVRRLIHPRLISPRVRLRLWQIAIVAILAGMPAWFFLLRGPRILDSDPLLFGGWVLFSLLILGIWLLLITTPADAIKLPVGRSRWIILLGAVWLHANAIGWLMPALSDDALRYRLDGRLWLKGVSPYAISPSGFLDQQEQNWRANLTGFQGCFGPPTFIHSFDMLDLSVPYPAMPTVYLPVAEAVFTGLKKIEMKDDEIGLVDPRRDWRANLPSMRWASRLLTWRLAFGGMMLIATWFLISAAVRSGRSPWWAAIVAWHPLAIVETSGMAHQDAIGIMLIAMAVWAWVRASGPLSLRERAGVRALADAEALGITEHTEAAGRPYPNPLPGGEGTRHALSYTTLPITRPSRLWLPIAGICLALAVGVKPLAVVIAAFWFIARPRASWVVPFVVICLMLGSAFLYQDGYVGFLETLRTYTTQWEAGGSVFHFIRAYVKPVWLHGGPSWLPELFIEPWDLARMIGAIACAFVAIAMIFRRGGWANAHYWIVLTVLLVAPVVYPWYLLWVLVIVPLLSRGRGLTILVFAATSVFNYRLWRTDDWVLPWEWALAMYVPVYLALAIEIIAAVRTSTVVGGAPDGYAHDTYKGGTHGHVQAPASV